MKLVTYEVGRRQSFGLVAGEDIVDLAGRMSLPSIVALLSAGRLNEAAEIRRRKAGSQAGGCQAAAVHP